MCHVQALHGLQASYKADVVNWQLGPVLRSNAKAPTALAKTTVAQRLK
jgi:hypothetical protein